MRAFHTTTAAYKSKPGKAKDTKSKKNNNSSNGAAAATETENSHDDDDDPNGPKHPPANPENPLDFADVLSRMRRHDEYFRGALKKLKTGGRFNPDILGTLRVQPDRKNSTVTYPLRELAQVSSQGGRIVSVLAHEEAYVKPILSAVQASPDFNQQPQRVPDNELELLLRIEPESREDLLRRVKATCNDWRDRARATRRWREKHHANWRKDGGMGPDLKRAAEKELDKVVKAKMVEIDDAEKEALKAAESK